MVAARSGGVSVMPFEPSAEHQVLLGALNRQREHVLEAVDGVGANDLRRQVLPSAWSCIGLVNHLSLDVERFWFQAVMAGDKIAIEDVLASSENAWKVSDGDSSTKCFTSTEPTSSMPMGLSPVAPLTRRRPGGPTFLAPGGSKASARSCYTF